MYIYEYVYVHIYVYMYVCMCVYIYIYVGNMAFRGIFARPWLSISACAHKLSRSMLREVPLQQHSRQPGPPLGRADVWTARCSFQLVLCGRSGGRRSSSSSGSGIGVAVVVVVVVVVVATLVVLVVGGSGRGRGSGTGSGSNRSRRRRRRIRRSRRPPRSSGRLKSFGLFFRRFHGSLPRGCRPMTRSVRLDAVPSHQSGGCEPKNSPESQPLGLTLGLPLQCCC